MALRRAAVTLMSERGYSSTSTDDIARAARVSPRTFFNYFPTKDAVLFLSPELVTGLVAGALRARPPGEDPAAAVAASAVIAFARFDQLVGDEARTLMRATLQMAGTEPEIRRILFDRRQLWEETAWQTLLERGVSSEDLAARAAVTTVVALGFLALLRWAEDATDEPFVPMLARCLLAAPHPDRLSAGTTSAVLTPSR
jgi:AcrR family transcriptional regulator